MHARNRTWPLGQSPEERCRQRILPIEGGDGSTLSLDFTTGVLDPRLTFTRDSNATFINSSGLVQYADANMVVNADFVGAGTGNSPTAWTGSTGVNLSIPATGVRRAETTTAAMNYIQSVNLTTSTGLTYSTSVYVNEVSGQHYTNTLGITGSATTIGYFRNGSSVNQFATALPGLITVVWTATGTHGIRVGIGSTGSNVANAICEFTQPRTVLGNFTQPTFFANSSTTAAYHAPRFDYDPTTLAPRGLLIEGTASTLNQWGEDYTNSYWTKVGSSVSATSVAGPDNVSTATRRIVESATTAQHGIRRGIATTAGQAHTVSVFVKPGSYDSFGFELFWSASYNAKAEVTSISGNTATVTSASGVNATLTRTVLAASGWYRYALTFTHPLAVGAATPDFNVLVKQTAAYAGNGTNYMDVYGFMLEAGSGASSYIPTGGSTGTRNQDQVQMTDLALLGFNTSAGTMTINGTYVKDANSAAFPRSIRFMGASVQSMAMITSGKTLFGNTPNTSGGSYFEASRTLASAGAFKFGWTLTTAVNPALASATVSLNGSSTSITPLGQGAIVNPTSLQFLYGAGAATDYPSMNISSLKYWPYATTAADLNVRTSL